MTLDRVKAHTPDRHALLDNQGLTFGRERTGVVGRKARAAPAVALRAYDGAPGVISHDADSVEAIGIERRIDLRPCG
ncbi:hypothetical protein [uncultured Brevundimonas sp.]|uniref:hypothetical protein n=1 Tax=uncultured Brevundimonas sp. TaxID=213418 RepID=UPI002625BE20|nr:hypothetical protein [uncultured Brevundimonas sp.]